MKEKQAIQVGQKASGKSVGSKITGFQSGISVWGPVVAVRETYGATLVDIEWRGLVVPCLIETVEVFAS